ncbi:MAG: N-acetyl-gamma-glutamyl-phosphate reductase [Lachnospiraceae bacterium]|nr:N-acetyl-gamma-glutamyl-phosphate reductase [Lachnospiraceae bacterium]
MIKAGIVGATGYAGAELVRLLAGHEQAQVIWYGSKSYVGEDFASIYKNARGFTREECKADDLEKMAEECDVIFTATPQGYLGSVLTEDILKKTKVIDLSADYRLSDIPTYEKWYGIEHKSPQLVEKAVYGLPELHRDDIKNTDLVANPGCYTTCSILTAYPLVAEGLIDPDTLIIDAASGTSGAGRGAKVPNLFCEVNENMKPYGVTSHRHTPEIEQELSLAADHQVVVNFTPHLAPMNRGILATEYASLVQSGGSFPAMDDIRAAYEKYYGNEYFIRILPAGEMPETRWVEGSNFVDIGFIIDERTHRVIMVGAIDNLVKGAAGQAVQNMNILFGMDEKTGLTGMPVFP